MNLHLDRTKRPYSLTRAVGLVWGGHQLDGVEAEASDWARSRATTELAGQFSIPFDPEPALLAEMYPGSQKRDLTTTTGTGAVFTLPQLPMIERLRARMVLADLGATYLTNLRAPVGIPRQTSTASATWLSEGGTASNSALGLDNVNLTPSVVIGGPTNVTRQFINQASIDADELLLNDFAGLIGVNVEYNAFNGAGSGSYQPVGILNNSTVQTQSAGISNGPSGGLPVYSTVAGMATRIQVANADRDVKRMGYAMTPALENTLRQTQKVGSGNTTSSLFVLTDFEEGVSGIGKHRAVSTTNLPANLTKGSGSNLSALVCGHWPDLIVGFFHGADVVVNPHTNQSSGSVLVSMSVNVAIAFRHPEAFIISVDNTTLAY